MSWWSARSAKANSSNISPAKRKSTSRPSRENGNRFLSRWYRGHFRETKRPASDRTNHLPVTIRGLAQAHLAAFVGAEPEALLFPTSRGNPPATNLVDTYVKAAAADIGMQGVTFHSFRHLGGTLTAQTGSVAANGSSGVADATAYAYAPLGWDRVYGALTFTAAGNHLDANIKVGSGTLRHPLVVVRGFTSGTYPTLTLNGQALVMDQDWFPSLRAGSNELWITLNRDLAGASNRIVIAP